MRRLARSAALAVALAGATGCYHYAFEQQPPAPGQPVTRHTMRVATWLNGLVGTGRVNTGAYCAQPVRTELEVRATDVLLSLVTLFIYTPHTLTVTCAR